MRRKLSACLVALVALATVTSSRAFQSAQRPQFRAGVTLVPIEVRVVDMNGNPINDLTREDFIVKESGALQEVAHFQAIGSEDDVPRTFILMLGRGRLNDPTGAVEALVDFVRVKLRPVDRVGVIAYRKAIPATTDREAVAAFLTRYRDMHSATDGLLARDNAGRALPKVIQADTRVAMDATFEQPGLTVQDLAGGEGNSAIRYTDFSYLKNALYYLRFLDGDKHVIVVTEKPFAVGRTSDNLLESFWFMQATSARATLNFIHAGGMPGNAGSTAAGAALIRTAQQMVAEQTGGSSSFFQSAAKPLDTLERATRSYYLVGYYPTRDVPPEQYREIEVTVRRPGAKISYRRGYQAQPSDKPEDERETIIAARMDDGATRLLNPVTNSPDSPMGYVWETRLKAVMTNAIEPRAVNVEVSFDPLLTAKSFEKIGDRYIFEFELVLLADDAQRNVMAEMKRHIKVDLSAAEYAQTKRRWPTFDVTLEVKTAPTYVRAILYHFDTDRLASGQTKVTIAK